MKSRFFLAVLTTLLLSQKASSVPVTGLLRESITFNAITGARVTLFTSDLNRFIHYHNVTVLVPDGRVIATGGAGLTSNRSFAGDDSSIEAFEPPYLFRGVRPRIDSVSTIDLVPGSNFNLRVSLSESLTGIVLVSARAATHWVDGGPQRFLSLDFTQDGSQVEAVIPNDAIKALAGYYILFAMVDDICSVGRIVRITPTPAPRQSLPAISVSAQEATINESGLNTGTFRAYQQEQP